MTNAAEKQTTGAIAPTDTRSRLVRTALRMFAERGIAGVSTRAIQTAAGSQNASAVQYHFRNKMGLVEAVMNLVGERLGEAIAASVDDAAEIPADPRELFSDLLRPYIELYLDPEIGTDAIKFLSRLQMESDPELRPVFREQLGPYATRLEERMRAAFPDLPPDVVRLRLLFTLGLILHSFASIERLRDSTLGEMEPPPAEEVLREFVEFVAGAWTGPTTD